MVARRRILPQRASTTVHAQTGARLGIVVVATWILDGTGTGRLAAATAASRRRPAAHAQPAYFDEGPYGFRSPVAGPSTNRRGWESRSDAHDWHQSTGFGGTRNR